MHLCILVSSQLRLDTIHPPSFSLSSSSPPLSPTSGDDDDDNSSKTLSPTSNVRFKPPNLIVKTAYLILIFFAIFVSEASTNFLKWNEQFLVFGT